MQSCDIEPSRVQWTGCLGYAWTPFTSRADQLKARLGSSSLLEYHCYCQAVGCPDAHCLDYPLPQHLSSQNPSVDCKHLLELHNELPVWTSHLVPEVFLEEVDRRPCQLGD